MKQNLLVQNPEYEQSNLNLNDYPISIYENQIKRIDFNTFYLSKKIYACISITIIIHALISIIYIIIDLTKGNLIIFH